jgi:hypothetical protein
LESQLQVAKHEAKKLQVQLKALSPIERMKQSHEKHTTQQQIHTIQSKVMEVTQQLQPVQDKACQLFTEIESQGTELEQVMNSTQQRLEGSVNAALIQEFIRARGHGTTAGRSSSSQARGIQDRTDQT